MREDPIPDRPAFTTTELWRRFLPYLWPKGETRLKAHSVIALVLMVVAKVAGIVVPFFYQYAVDALNEQSGPVYAVALGMVAAYGGVRFFSTAFQHLRDAAYVRVGQRAIRNLALDVFRHLHILSLRFHLERRTGGLSRAIERGTRSIDSMLYFILFNIAPTVVELGAVLAIFQIKFGWELVILTLISVVLYIGFTMLVSEWRTKLRRVMVREDNHANARAVDSLLNYETVKYFANERHEERNYDQALARFEVASVKSETSLAVLNIGQGLITSLCLAGAMAIVVLGMRAGRFSLGELVMVNAMLLQLFRPLDILGWVYREIKQGLVDMEVMFGLLARDPEVPDAPDARPLQIEGGEVRFEHVAFHYDHNRPILRDVDFTIPAGRTLAVVGHSGAGKSTLSRILFRFYDISGGRVLIDGQDIKALTQASLRAAIGIVPQDTVLFNDSIGYNIAYGRPGASQAEVEQAARRAQIHDFVASLPDGYATMVGERGLKLSGGEKQRVAIARTLLKDPPILILDEATSALDTKTERGIQTALADVAQGRTTLIIAHRLSTVVNADEIIVMEKGAIIERGNHKGLLDSGGVYAQMWREQQKAARRAERAAPELA